LSTNRKLPMAGVDVSMDDRPFWREPILRNDYVHPLSLFGSLRAKREGK
jgi:hypothetical protein